LRGLGQILLGGLVVRVQPDRLAELVGRLRHLSGTGQRNTEIVKGVESASPVPGSLFQTQMR
jgi:hypothetical protein